MNAPELKWSHNVDQGKQTNWADISDDGKVLITGTSQEYPDQASKDFALYIYDSNQTLTGKIPVKMESMGGIYWVALSGDGNYAVAGGECIGDALSDKPKNKEEYDNNKSGFVMGCNIQSKEASRFALENGGRVNQVAINHDGRYFVAVMESGLYLYKREDNAYVRSDSIDLCKVDAENLTDGYLYTCEISSDGQWIVVGCEYSQETSSNDKKDVGVVYLFKNDKGKLENIYSCVTESPILRTVSTPDGDYFAASEKNGQVSLFKRETSQQKAEKLWSHSPDVGTFAYAVAITKTSSSEVLVGFGYNNKGNFDSNYGYASMLQNSPGNNGSADTCNVLWKKKLDYCPNPGMSLDTEGQFLTATDGEPIFNDKKNDTRENRKNKSAKKETPGNFYLINARTGDIISNKKTPIMAWPMKINPGGTACVGADDNANIYYWEAMD